MSPRDRSASRVIVAVYEPPQSGLPHLCITIDESGAISAIGFETSGEATAYAERAAETIVAAAIESMGT
jgi:hypothetical protein